MQIYGLFKQIHMAAVGLSGLFFALRGLWMIYESSLLNTKLVRVLPHVIDTVLLLSAAVLIVHMGGIPLWVQVKVLALFVYVAFGMAAFKGGSMGMRMTAFFMGLLTYSFIISVAVSKNPYGFLARFF